MQADESISPAMLSPMAAIRDSQPGIAQITISGRLYEGSDNDFLKASLKQPVDWCG